MTSQLEHNMESKVLGEFAACVIRGIQVVGLGKDAFNPDNLAPSRTGYTCALCHKPPPEGQRLRTCSSCRARNYCGAACAKEAWTGKGHAGHRVECFATTTMRELVAERPALDPSSDEAVLLVRNAATAKFEKQLLKALKEEKFRQKVVAEAEAAKAAKAKAAAVASASASASASKTAAGGSEGSSGSSGIAVEETMSLYAVRHSKTWEQAYALWTPPKLNAASLEAARRLRRETGQADRNPTQEENKALHKFTWQELLKQCPLHCCVGSPENLPALRLFLEAGEDVDSTADDLERGTTPLFAACRDACRNKASPSTAGPPFLGAIEALLAAGASVDAPADAAPEDGGPPCDRGCPPIWQAVYQSPPEVLGLLVKHGGVRTANLPGATAGVSNTLVVDALLREYNGRRDNAEIVRLLLEGGAGRTVNDDCGAPHHSALHLAVSHYCIASLGEADERRGKESGGRRRPPRTGESFGRGVSPAFVKEQALTIVTKLAEHGADLCQGKIKGAKQPGMLPLMVAVSRLYKANYKYVEDCHADTQTAVLELLEAALLGVRCRIVRQRQRVRRSKSSPQQPGGGGGAEGYVLRVGDVVKLVGLQGANGTGLNGELACIVGCLPPDYRGAHKKGGGGAAGAAAEAEAERKYTVRLFSDGSRRKAKCENLDVGSISDEEWRECGEPQRGLWVKTSLKQTELNLGQQNGLCLGWLLYHMGQNQAVSQAEGDLVLRNALIDKLEMYDLLLHDSIRSFDFDGPTRRSFIGRLAAGKANFQYVNVGAASFANVDWLQAAEAGGAAEDESKAIAVE